MAERTPDNPSAETARASVEALLTSEERFRLILESVRDHAIFMLDVDGHVATWNGAAERFTGYRADEILERHCSVFFTTEDVARGRPEAELEIAARDGRLEVEDWRIRKDGSRFWADVVVSAVRGSDGALVGFTKVVRDVTDRRRATEQFRLALEAAPTSIAKERSCS